MASHDQPPFGAYKLSPLRRVARDAAQKLKRQDFVGHQLRTTLFKLAGGKAPGGVYDVDVFGTQKARLRPGGNVCEKRCYSAAQFWDREERVFLAEALFGTDDAEPVFLDIGANVGLYGLAMQAQAESRRRKLRIVAVEPDPELRERLRFNFEASGVPDYELVAAAITSEEGPISFCIDLDNRGRNSVGEGDLTVEGRRLPNLLRELGIGRIAAMKIDVEGHEIDALTPLFEADRSLWPKAISIEIEGHGAACGAAFCEARGYERVGQTAMNALLRLPG
jgi:FkbM family methyltransferase